MALSSQSSRSGMGGRYRAARRRGRRWRWLLLVLLLAAGGWYLFSGGDDETGTVDGEQVAAAPRSERGSEPAATRQPSNASNTPSRSATSNTAGTSVARAGAGSTRVDDMTPVAEVQNAATRSGATAGSGRENGSSSNSTTSRSTSRKPAAARQAPPTPNRSTPARASAPSRGTSPTVGIESAEIRQGMDLIADGKVIEGRRALSALLFDGRRRLSTSDARAIRETLASVNDRLVFSPEVTAGDPIAEQYQVQSGDLLVRIARRYKLTYQFLEQINRIDARRLQVGQSIKLIRGPFHARVSKSAYRMDVFVRQSDGSPIYIRSFAVGLGEDDSTPEGTWVIEPNRKVVNPDWRNPRTGEYYQSDDPENPIGDYWLALEGIDTNTANQQGYGIHGTIDPDSVGQSVSMGCIRLRDDDIEQVFHMLVEGESTVEVVP